MERTIYTLRLSYLLIDKQENFVILIYGTVKITGAAEARIQELVKEEGYFSTFPSKVAKKSISMYLMYSRRHVYVPMKISRGNTRVHDSRLI